LISPTPLFSPDTPHFLGGLGGGGGGLGCCGFVSDFTQRTFDLSVSRGFYSLPDFCGGTFPPESPCQFATCCSGRSSLRPDFSPSPMVCLPRALRLLQTPFDTAPLVGVLLYKPRSSCVGRAPFSFLAGPLWQLFLKRQRK